MAFQIFYFIIYMAEAVIAYMYFSDNYENKYKFRNSFAIVICLYILGFMVNYISHNNFVINMATFFIINIAYSLLSYEIALKDSIFHSTILLAIMFLSEMIIEATASSILHIPLDAYSKSLSALTIMGIMSKVLYMIVGKLISVLFSYKKSNGSNNIKNNFSLFLFPLIIIVMLALFLYTSTMYDFTRRMKTVYAVISIVSLVFCCLIFVINQKMQSQQAELIELQSEAQKNEINKTFYELLERKNEDQRVLVHDIKHHFSAISMMNDVDEIKNYLANIQPQFEEYKYIGKSKNKMLDLIISKYSYICEKSNIDFNADVRSSNLSFIEDSDLTSLLSNLLDNAVEAAKGAPNASIRFLTKKENNFFILSVVNTSSHAPKSSGEKLITTKQDNAIHGYGSKSIERTAKKYNGICSWDYNESDRSFHYNIIFNS